MSTQVRIRPLIFTDLLTGRCSRDSMFHRERPEKEYG